MKTQKVRFSFILCAILALGILLEVEAGAFWVWTPQSKKWVNPKLAVKDTPKEQFEWAMSFYNSGDYTKALQQFEKLIKHFPNSQFTSEAQYYVGLCWEKKEEYYQAFTAYQKVLEAYPYSERVNEIIGRQYNIGKIFYQGHKSKILGLRIMPSIDKAQEVFKKVVENAPYGEYANQAQFDLGLAYKEEGKYQEAQGAFQKLLEDYPNTELADEALFQIGLCSSGLSSKASYDQLHTEESIERFQEFVKRHPQSEKAPEASQFVDQLKERKAHSIFQTAKFYERIKKFQSAAIYYNEIVEDYPKTTWAAKALERLKVIEEKFKKDE